MQNIPTDITPCLSQHEVALSRSYAINWHILYPDLDPDPDPEPEPELELEAELGECEFTLMTRCNIQKVLASLCPIY